MGRGTADLLAGALVAALRRDGLEPDPALRLVRQGPPPVADPLDLREPADLGRLHERLATDAERTRRGAWYTPGWLADALVERALPDAGAASLGPVVDPACGGGAFLLAAAERLRHLGRSAAEAVAHLRGGDLDPLAVAVAEAALWWWSARLGDPARPRLEVADALLAPAPDAAAGAVVGNPPFHGQLRRGTAVDAARREALRARFGDAVRPYTDPAWLFLLRAVDDVAPGGRVALVQPQSLLGARDAGAVRAAVDRRARLVDLLVDDGAAFDADVATCAPVLHRCADGAPNDWTGALADAAGVPPVDLGSGGTLGDLATTHAGFRDEYYGTVDAVAEGGPGPRLVTAGAIDPLRLLTRPQRFAGRRWDDPRVCVTALAGRAARWAAVQAGPKLLVATQTRILEAVADLDGALHGSVPVVVVRPHDPADTWRLAAALHAPVASAWLLRRSAGTALSAGACRPTAALLAALPVPPGGAAWDAAADAAERASRGEGSLDEVARLADAAHGTAGDATFRWWSARRPRR